MKYKIVRFYSPSQKKNKETIKMGLTLAEARRHCNDPKTKAEGKWFDGYEKEGR